MAFKRFGHSWLSRPVSLSCALSAAAAEPYRIVGFGDSLMAGYGLEPGEGFPEKLQAALQAKGHDVVIANAGVSGDTTSGGLSRLDWSVPDGTELVILELGANDMLRGVAPEITEKNLDAMLGRLKERNITVLLAGMRAAPNLGADYQAAFDAIYPAPCRKIRRRRSIRSSSTASRPTAACCWRTACIPNAAGVDRMVERILPTVEKLIAANPDDS